MKQVPKITLSDCYVLIEQLEIPEEKGKGVDITNALQKLRLNHESEELEDAFLQEDENTTKKIKDNLGYNLRSKLY